MFEIFLEGGHWCARRSDGLVCGLFRERAAAERFARTEEEIPSLAPSQASACSAAVSPLPAKTQV